MPIGMLATVVFNSLPYSRTPYCGSAIRRVKYRFTGVLKKFGKGLKILGNGELTRKITVRAHEFSEAAKAKIEAAGGTVEVIPPFIPKPIKNSVKEAAAKRKAEKIAKKK